jgi:hypothetical protein
MLNHVTDIRFMCIRIRIDIRTIRSIRNLLGFILGAIFLYCWELLFA